MNDLLRPIERRVLALRAQGMDAEEIGLRFRKSADQIERIILWTLIPRRRLPSRVGMTPQERRVMALRASGHDYDDIALRFRRSPEHIRRVERWALLRLELGLA